MDFAFGNTNHLQQIMDCSIHHKDKTVICHHLSMIWFFGIILGVERSTTSHEKTSLPITRPRSLWKGGRMMQPLDRRRQYARSMHLAPSSLGVITHGKGPLSPWIDTNGVFHGKVIEKWRISQCLVYGYIWIIVFQSITIPPNQHSPCQLEGWETTFL